MPREIVYKLKPSNLHQGDAKIRWWEAHPEAGTPYEDILKPEYWSFSNVFEIHDNIRVLPEEGNYWAHLLVLSAGVGGTKVVEIAKVDIAEDVAAPTSLHEHYQIKWAGPSHRFRIERVSDGHIEKTNFQSEAEANKWLGENANALIGQVKKAA